MSSADSKLFVRVCGITDVGRKRTNNEDAWLVSNLLGETITQPGTVAQIDVTDKGVLLAVSDGMGGARAGEVASALVIGALERELGQETADPDEGITRIISSAVEKANREVWQQAHAEESKQGMGATLTAALIRGGTVHIAEVGDSRAYLIRGRTIRQVTRDQSYAQQLIDAGVLRADDIGRFPMKNMILQAMGQKENVSVEIGRLELRRGDWLVLCSDGLHGKVKDAEIKFAVLGAKTIEEACTKLVGMANERGGEDNITLVVAQVDGEALQPNVEGERVTQTFAVVAKFDPIEDPGDIELAKGFDSGSYRSIKPEDATDTKPSSNTLLPAIFVLLAITALFLYLMIR